MEMSYKKDFKEYKCEFCGSSYPEFDKTEIYYSVNVFGRDRIICGSCKKRLKKIE